MVLQRAPKSAKIWGFGALGAEVRVQFGEETYFGIVQEKMGSYVWTVNLPPQPAGGPHTITATQTDNNQPDGGVSTIELKNVLFGDVWLCAGQSNMAVTVPNVSQSH